jgi:hypothetical protein
VTSEEIVKALAIATTRDADFDVRGAALFALQAPVHQAFLQDRPDFLARVAESAMRTEAQMQLEEEDKYVDEFRRRLSRERRNYLIFFVCLIASLALMIFLLSNSHRQGYNPVLCIFQVGVYSLAGLFIFISWRSWRCPACDSWLSGFKAGINPFFASPPIKCPHCGKKLM